MWLAGIGRNAVKLELDTYELARLAQACRVAAAACAGSIDSSHVPELRDGPEAPDAAWYYESIATYLEVAAVMVARQSGQCLLSGPEALRWVRALRSPVVAD